MENTKILLVDDEKSIVKMLEMVLRKEGFTQIHSAHTAKEALGIIEKESMDIIVLDVMLPDQTGFEVCRSIRDFTDAHILFLTAKVSDLDVLTGFSIGGDDYVTKPFNPLEIVARIKAVLRRKGDQQVSGQLRNGAVYEYGHFQVNELTKELMVDGKTVSCPAQIFKLLLFFCKNPSQVFSKNDLFEKVWGLEAMVDDNTVMVHIRRLRERIEPDPSIPRYLLTVRGLGYKLVKENVQ